MGINYYANMGTCKECGQSKITIHLGKANRYRRFLFKEQTKYYNNFKEFKDFIHQTKTIITTDEDKTKPINKELFIEMINESQQHVPRILGKYTKTWKDGSEYSEKEFN
jgi:hypothetical protein